MKQIALAAALVVALIAIVLIFRPRDVDPVDESPPTTAAMESPEPVSPPEATPATVEVAETQLDDSPPNTIIVSGVVEDATGNRVPNAIIEAQWRTGNKSATADETGRFTLGLPKNSFAEGPIVFLRKADYEGRTYDVPFRGDVNGNELTGFLDSQLGQIPVKGQRAGEGEGAFGIWETVLTYNGDEYPGILNISRRPDRSITGTWDDDLGPAELVDLVAPETITLSAEMNALRAFPDSFDVPQSGRDDITLVMTATASIEGLVRDSRGTPLGGWTVLTRGESPRQRTTTDEAGAFAFTGLAPGTYELYAAEPHGDRDLSTPDPIALNPGEHMTGIELVYHIRQTLVGQVWSSDGNPVVGARVRAVPAEGQLPPDEPRRAYQGDSDASGQYEVAGLPEQPGIIVDVSIFHEGHLRKSVYGVIVDGSAKDFVLIERPTVTGRVLDAETREPVTEFRMYSWVGESFQEADYLRSTTRRELEPHPDGTFSFQPTGVNDLRIGVSAPGYLTGLLRLPNIRAGETVADVEILLEPTESLTGSVQDENGSPIRDARIFLGYPLMVDGSVGVLGNEGLTKTDAQGAFAIAEYPESLKIVSAYHPSCAPNWTTVDSFNAPLTITLPTGGSIEGYVTYGGAPLNNNRAHVNILAASEEATVMQARPGDEGFYSIDKLPLGEIVMSVGFHEGGIRRYIHRKVNVQPGETIRQNFDFGDAFDSYVEGTLLLNDQPVEIAILRAVVPFANGDYVYYQTEPAADGSFRLGPIPAARFEFGAVWLKLEDGSYLEPAFETVTTRRGETTLHDLRYSN